MIMQDNEKKPALRFKDFTDPWEQRKLGDITVELSEYATQELGLPLLTSSRSGLMYQDEYRDSRTTKSTETLFSVVPVGTCTYRHMSDDDVFHMNINTLEKGLVSREYPVFEASKGNNLEFLVQHINSSEEFKAFCAEQKKGGTRTRLYYNTLCQFTVRVPALKEQAQISQCLKKLDTLITLHQRKYEKLVNIKKSMLDKMFPKNGASVPEIRFKGFTDPWEQRKLGDAFERVVRKNTNNESRLPLTISAQDGLVDQITYFNNRVASRDVSNYYLVYNGEFAYNKSTSDGYPFGAVKRLDWYEKGVLSTLYIVFALKHPEKDDSDFMTVFYDTDRWHRGVAERAAEGARNHGLLNISADDFFDIDTTMPEDKVEQEKIGRLLKKLDTLITLHQRKLEKLQNIKKSCLEKMFV